MRIVSVNCDLDAALTALGHEVQGVRIGKPGVYAAEDLLKDFKPDLFLQKEHLGARILFRDLPTLPCLKAFWSIDTHLNAYWQQFYGRLFDVFFTPHLDFLARLAPWWPHPRIVRLAVAGFARPWTAHAARDHDLSFVGRLSGFRPLRRHFCQVLQSRYKVAPLDGLDRQAMLSLYDRTRLLPNESIAFETNFRLLEGASAGCCVISPDIGSDQDNLLEPGTEVLVYRDGLECLDLIDTCLSRPDEAERIGRAAHRRILSDHLPEHRARTVVQTVRALPRSAASGPEAENCLAASLCLLHLSGELRLANFDLFCRTSFADREASLTFRLLEAAKTSSGDLCSMLPEAESFLRNASSPGRARNMLASVCGGLTLFRHDPAASLRFLALHGSGEPAGSTPEALIPVGEAWVRRLAAEGQYAHLGFQYIPGGCLSALDFVMLLAGKEPTDPAWARSFLSLEPLRRCLPQFDASAHARLSLCEPDSIEASLEYIAASLRFFDLHTARSETAALLERADEAGLRERVSRLLSLRFPHLHSLDTLGTDSAQA